MATKPKFYVVRPPGTSDVPVDLPSEGVELEEVGSLAEALDGLARGAGQGILLTGQQVAGLPALIQLTEGQRILEGMPDGVAVVDVENRVVWANQQFRRWAASQDIVGQNFYDLLDHPEILGPDFCPFSTSLATGEASVSTVRTGDKYLQLNVAPLHAPAGEAGPALIVVLRDVTQQVLQQQKLAAIHSAGLALADLTPEEVFHMELEERVELLKANILRFTKDVLNFDVIEIRLLDQHTGELTPLLSVGIAPEAARRRLFARPQGNGVTGFVAATGKSYLCEDTREDPLYIEGFKGARSSLTVPLIWHDQVVGTFNVESPEPRAFTESDLQFLEIFSRDVAVALNTLELLAAQRANTAQQSVEAIHSAVALPVDDILNDAVKVMEHYIGHEPEVVERLRRILTNARDIKRVIQKVGQRLAPAEAVPASVQLPQRPKLQGRRILVVDADAAVRNDAHALLERYACSVETARTGHEALLMVDRGEEPYDVIIADIRLPDIAGHELFYQLKQRMDPVPLVLMSGFGYDPSHAIVNARRAGLHPKGVLYKPFRLDQLLETVETILDACSNVAHS